MEDLRKHIKNKNNQMLKSNFLLCDLFEIIHNQEDRIFCEYLANFRIKEINYSEMKKYIFKMATFLNKNISLEKGKFVGILMENSINWIAVFWGLLMIGYKPLLLNARLPFEMNEKVLAMASCESVIADESFTNYKLNTNILFLQKSIGFLSDIDKEEEIREKTWENEIALSTTATTLNIKLCIYKGEEIIYQCLNTNGILAKNKMIKTGYKGKIKVLMFLPLYHVFGLFASYFWFSIYGRSFVFLNDYSTDTILKTIRKHEVTHVFAVPLLWHSLYKEIIKQVNRSDEKTKKKFNFGVKFSIFIQKLFPKFGLSVAKKLFAEIHDKTFGPSIKFMISGGSSISEPALKTINALGYPLYVGYGSTEIGITSVELRKNIKHRIKGSIGQPFDSVKYSIVSDILKVSGKSICSKIISSHNVLVVNHEDWFNTNDIAKCDKKNNYFILGRNDDVFVGVNGEKINPDLIEKELEFSHIDRFVITTIEAEGKKCLSLILEVRQNLNSLFIDQIKEEVEKNILKLSSLNYQIEQIFFTFDMIANPNAIKVSRNALKKMIDTGKTVIEPISKLYAECRKSDEVISREICDGVKNIMSNILSVSVDEIKDTDHFIFDLGASSLDYCTLLIELKKTYEVEFDFQERSCSTAVEFSNYIVNYFKRG